jgi:hypothetical protein
MSTHQPTQYFRSTPLDREGAMPTQKEYHESIVAVCTTA